MTRSRPFTWIAAAIFALMALAHIYRLITHFQIVVGSHSIPEWVSIAAIVVTAFLIGLGFGSLIGGELSKSAQRLLVWFGIIELSVAAYGSISVQLFRAVGDLAAAWPAVLAQAASFVLVLAPTLLMGATLPLLVAYAVRVSGNVGRSVGWLYFVNTAGSAIAAISTALFVLGHFGERGSVWLAALVNASVGTFVLTRHRHPGQSS